MIRDFENWYNNIGEAAQLDELRGLRVAIEAADYIQTRILRHHRALEPLLPALGGLPLGLKPHIEEDLAKWATYQIQPFFVFSGLDLAKPTDPFHQKSEGASMNASAWGLYDAHQAEQSVHEFGKSSQSLI